MRLPAFLSSSKAGLSGLARLVAALACVLAPLAAAAEPGSVDGDYTSTALREVYTIQNWQAQCGPVPKSTSTGGGGTASIRESGGVLSIASSERSYRSSQCYDSMPTLKAEPAQHDASAGTWRVRCSTPESDPRKAVMNTLVAVGKNRVDIVETGRYEIRLQGGLCVADVRRSQAFLRVDASAAVAVADAASPEPTPEPAPAPAPPAGCAEPGPAQRFELNPTRKVAVAGSEFRVRIDVFDANGCSVTPTPLLTGAESLRIEPRHESAASRKEPVRSVLVRVPDDAPEGSQAIAFQQGKAEGSVSVEIVSKSRYDELFATGELQALEESPDGGTSEPIRFTPPTTPENTGGEARKRKFLVLVAALLALLALIGVVLGVRSRRALQRKPAPRPAPLRASPQSPMPSPARVGMQRAVAEPDRTLAMQRSSLADTNRQPRVMTRDVRTCPVCANEFEPPLQFCPHDGAQLGDGKSSVASGVVCPICRRGFDFSVKTCPDHGEELVPKSALGHFEPEPRKQAKICPACGERFEGETAFCGKDGTQLVVLN